MKNIIFFITLILCVMISSVNAQNASRGAKAAKATVSIPNYSFKKALSVNEDSKVITAEEEVLASEVAPAKRTVRRVAVAANIPGNYVIGKTATPEYNPVLKHAAATNPRICQSQPISISKTVTVQ